MRFWSIALLLMALAVAILVRPTWGALPAGNDLQASLSQSHSPGQVPAKSSAWDAREFVKKHLADFLPGLPNFCLFCPHPAVPAAGLFCSLAYPPGCTPSLQLQHVRLQI